MTVLLFLFCSGFFYVSPLEPNTLDSPPLYIPACFSRTSNHHPGERKAPASLALSLLEETRAKFLFSSKCLLKSPAHTCQRRTQFTLVARMAAPACACTCTLVRPCTLHTNVPRAIHPETDGDMCITCSGGQGHATQPSHTHAHTWHMHKTTPASCSVSSPPPPLPPFSLPAH